MGNKRNLIVTAVLLAVTAVTAVIYLSVRSPEVDNCVVIDGQAVPVGFFDRSSVEGQIINGKGQLIHICARGCNLFDIIPADREQITVTAADAYRAVLSRNDEANAFLILCDDGSVRLIVFGDGNSKRDVKNVSRIDCE